MKIRKILYLVIIPIMVLIVKSMNQLSRVKVGSNVTFNSNVMVNARGKGSIKIGDNVLIGPNVVLRSCNHSFANLDEPIIKQGMIEGEIVIEDNVWIGSNCVILPKCKIGEGSIISPQSSRN